MLSLKKRLKVRFKLDLFSGQPEKLMSKKFSMVCHTLYRQPFLYLIRYKTFVFHPLPQAIQSG